MEKQRLDEVVKSGQQHAALAACKSSPFCRHTPRSVSMEFLDLDGLLSVNVESEDDLQLMKALIGCLVACSAHFSVRLAGLFLLKKSQSRADGNVLPWTRGNKEKAWCVLWDARTGCSHPVRQHDHSSRVPFAG